MFCSDVAGPRYQRVKAREPGTLIIRRSGLAAFLGVCYPGTLAYPGIPARRVLYQRAAGGIVMAKLIREGGNGSRRVTRPDGHAEPYRDRPGGGSGMGCSIPMGPGPSGRR